MSFFNKNRPVKGKEKGPSKNVPFTHAQVKALPAPTGHWEDVKDPVTGRKKGIKWVVDFGGFTSSGQFPNNATRRQFKQGDISRNKAYSRGAFTQQIPIVVKLQTKFGVVLQATNRVKTVRHWNWDIKNQAFRINGFNDGQL